MLAANAKISDNLMIVFRGKDKKWSMILMTLTTQKSSKQEDENKTKQPDVVILRLSYKLDPISPDVLTIKEGDF